MAWLPVALIPLNENEMGDRSLTSLSRRHHRKTTRVDLNLLPYAELFRLRRTTLRAAPPLYNLHSRNVRAAPRFSPARSASESPPLGVGVIDNGRQCWHYLQREGCSACADSHSVLRVSFR